MKKRLKNIALILVLFGTCLQASPVPIIIDTDWMTDCDDAAAIGVAHVLQDRGEAKLLGIVTSSHENSTEGNNTLAISAINYYYTGKYNSENIGAWHELTEQRDSLSISTSMKSNFAFHTVDNTTNTKVPFDEIRNAFSDDGILNHQRNSSLDVYTNLLDKSEERVTIIVIGHSFNIARLIENNATLVAEKVEKIYIGASAGSNVNISPNGASKTTGQTASELVFTDSPVPVYFWDHDDVYLELRTKSDYKKGQNNSVSSPMKTAYKNTYFGGKSGFEVGRPVYDQFSVLTAVRGCNYDGTQYCTDEKGTLTPDFIKTNRDDIGGTWEATNEGKHKKITSIETSVGGIIDALMLTEPISHMISPNSDATINTTQTFRWTGGGGWVKKTTFYMHDTSTGVEVSTSTNNNYYTASNLIEGHTIKVILTSKDENGDKIEKSKHYIYYVKLTNPTKIKATITNNNSVTLTWKDNSNNEQGYKIYVYKGSKLVDTITATGSSHKVTGLDADTTYTFKVKAYNSDGTSDDVSLTTKTPKNKKKTDDIPVTYLILN